MGNLIAMLAETLGVGQRHDYWGAAP